MGPTLPLDLWISSTSVPPTFSVSFLRWDRAELFAKRSVEKKNTRRVLDERDKLLGDREAGSSPCVFRVDTAIATCVLPEACQVPPVR